MKKFALLSIAALIATSAANAAPLNLNLTGDTAVESASIVNSNTVGATVRYNARPGVQLGVGADRGVVDSKENVVASVRLSNGLVSAELRGNSKQGKVIGTLKVAPRTRVYASMAETNGTLSTTVSNIPVTVKAHEKTAQLGVQTLLWNSRHANIGVRAGLGKSNVKAAGRSATRNFGTVGLSVTFK